MGEPLHARRQRLARIVQNCNQPPLVVSEAVESPGTVFFRKVAKLGLKGMVAKRRDRKYLPGQRTDAWIKVKKGENVSCAIIGYEPDGADDFRSLILAAEQDGAPHYGEKSAREST